MRFLLGLLFLFFFACAKEETRTPHNFTTVEIIPIVMDSTSVRAVAIFDNEVFYAGSAGHYGYFEVGNKTKIKKGIVEAGDQKPAFRAIGATTDAFFILSIGCMEYVIFNICRTCSLDNV